MPQESFDLSPNNEKRNFASTHWSIVLAAGDATREDARAALSRLCETYWYPLYAYVRRRGFHADDAQDLTQAFFARLIEKRSLQVADPQRGKFRTFLLTSMDHFLANERDRAMAKKRGGGRAPIALDLATGEARISLEPSHDLTAERLYLRQWALTLLEVVVDRLGEEFHTATKTKQFELFRDALTGDYERLPYAQIAVELGISVDNARQAAHRLRKRYRVLLREEVAKTVADPREVDEELTSLFEALGK